MADRSAALAMAEYKEKVEELETALYEVSSLPPGRARRRVLLLHLLSLFAVSFVGRRALSSQRPEAKRGTEL